MHSRTWDKKIPPEEGFLLFLSGTARACLVPRVPVWYRAWLSGTGCSALLLFIYVSNYDVTTQSATFPATSEGFRDVKKNIIGMFLLKMHISTKYEKNNQVPVLDADRQISVSGDTMSHPSLGYRLDWYLWHRITLDWDLSVWIQHWYLILLMRNLCCWVHQQNFAAVRTF